MITYVEFICKYSFAALDNISYNEQTIFLQFTKFYSSLYFDLLISVCTNKGSINMFKQSNMEQLCVNSFDHSQDKAKE
jgi:hypothetical protein